MVANLNDKKQTIKYFTFFLTVFQNLTEFIFNYKKGTTVLLSFLTLILLLCRHCVISNLE